MNQSNRKSEAEALNAVTRKIISPRFSWGVDDMKEIKAPPKDAKKKPI